MVISVGGDVPTGLDLPLQSGSSPDLPATSFPSAGVAFYRARCIVTARLFFVFRFVINTLS